MLYILGSKKVKALQVYVSNQRGLGVSEIELMAELIKNNPELDEADVAVLMSDLPKTMRNSPDSGVYPESGTDYADPRDGNQKDVFSLGYPTSNTQES